MISKSDEVRFHSIKSAFDPDEPQISEHTADVVALIAEVLSFAIVCVVLAFLIYGALG
jgi:hypothetical protein